VARILPIVALLLLLTLALLPAGSAATTHKVVVSKKAPFVGSAVFFTSRHHVYSGCGTYSIPHKPVFNLTRGVVRWSAEVAAACGVGDAVQYVTAGVDQLNFTVTANGSYNAFANWSVSGGLRYNLSSNGSASVGLVAEACVQDLTLGSPCTFSSGHSISLGTVGNGAGVKNFTFLVDQHFGGILVAGRMYSFTVAMFSHLQVGSTGGYSAATLDLWSGTYGARLISVKLTT